MPRAQDTCGRRSGHPGKCVTARALKQAVDNRPRKTPRRRGVRLADDPAVAARWRRTSKFRVLGISEERFLQMLEAQNHACAICKVPFEDDRRIFADHDHNCCPMQVKQRARTCGKCIRGLLCVKCNTALGYIEKHRDAVNAYLAHYEAVKAARAA